MKRLKTFGKYILLLIAFYVVSNILAYFCIQTTYSPMEKEINAGENIEINVSYAKATIINGKIEGKIKNISEEDINGKYIKCDFISKRGTKILTKYIQINELKAGEEKDFSISFRADNITKFEMQITDEYQSGENTKLIEALNKTSDEDKVAAFIAIFTLMHFFI